MTTPDRPVHIVFGATGAIGTAVVAELVRRGERVRAVSRRGQAPPGAEGVAADAADPALDASWRVSRRTSIREVGFISRPWEG